eukprot:3785950-Pyramimonas_sp.AAC.1
MEPHGVMWAPRWSRTFFAGQANSPAVRAAAEFQWEPLGVIGSPPRAPNNWPYRALPRHCWHRGPRRNRGASPWRRAPVRCECSSSLGFRPHLMLALVGAFRLPIDAVLSAIFPPVARNDSGPSLGLRIPP